MSGSPEEHAGPSPHREASPAFEPSPIRVGERWIEVEELLREAQYHPASSFEEACAEAARSLVVRRLLLDRAEHIGLLPSPGDSPAQNERIEQAAIERLLEGELPVPDISLDACRRFHGEHPERFRGAELFSASHILVLAPADDVEARENARTRALELLAEVTRAPDRFESLAAKHSGCPSARSGGALGQIEPGEVPVAFEEALRTLAPGQISSAPVETEHGFHVLRLDDRAPGLPLPFEAVRDKIRIYLRDREWRRSLRSYIEGLAERTRIEGFELV